MQKKVLPSLNLLGYCWREQVVGCPSSQKLYTPHPSSTAARHVPSPAQLHLNTLLLPNTWLHLPLSKWKISIICLSEYSANEGFHDKLGGGLLCKGEGRTEVACTRIKQGKYINGRKCGSAMYNFGLAAMFWCNNSSLCQNICKRMKFTLDSKERW